VTPSFRKRSQPEGQSQQFHRKAAGEQSRAAFLLRRKTSFSNYLGIDLELVSVSKVFRVLNRFITILAFTASCVSICLAQNKSTDPPQKPIVEYNQNAWREFLSPEGRFSIRMPGIPAQQSKETETVRGKVVMVLHMLETDSAVYMASYADLGVNSSDPVVVNRMLDGGRDQMLSNSTKKLLREGKLTLGDYSGREWVVEELELTLLTRAYFVSGRMYQTIIAMETKRAFKTGKASANPGDFTDFFKMVSSSFLDSFRLIEEMGEVDQMLRDLKTQHKGVVTMVGSTADPSDPNLITGGVLNGKAVHLVTPVYPAIARAAHASGQVQVQVLIGTEGDVIAAQVVSGHPLLRVAAIKAARESKFTPTLLEGKPVMVNGIIIYNFVAQ
jgi:TonB family protein